MKESTTKVEWLKKNSELLRNKFGLSEMPLPFQLNLLYEPSYIEWHEIWVNFIGQERGHTHKMKSSIILSSLWSSYHWSFSKTYEAIKVTPHLNTRVLITVFFNHWVGLRRVYPGEILRAVKSMGDYCDYYDY